MSENVFSEFCQAWVARFPGSELPAAWEEDVRANLKKHKTKVALLREELDKEEMYVDYLNKLLSDIEKQRRTSSASDKQNGGGDNNNDEEGTFVTVIDVTPTNGARRLAKPAASSPSTAGYSSFAPLEKPPPPPLKKPASFGVPLNKPPPPTRPRSQSQQSLNSVSSPTTPSSSVDHFIGGGSSDHFHQPREGLTTPPEGDSRFGTISSLRSSLGGPSSRADNTLSVDFSVSEFGDDVTETETPQASHRRGRPDGDETDIGPPRCPSSTTPDGSIDPLTVGVAAATSAAASISAGSSRVSRIKDLMANWERDSPNLSSSRTSTFERDASSRSSGRRLNSDSSSRGRMGSPSGKSHGSSDGEAGGEGSPGGARRRPPLSVSGEARLDRLVRRPSGGERGVSAAAAPPLPAAARPSKPQTKPRLLPPPPPNPNANSKDHLYDTVAMDEVEPVVEDEEEGEYDNHLIYDKSSRPLPSEQQTEDELAFHNQQGQHHHHFATPPAALLKSAMSGSGTLSSSTDTSSDVRSNNDSPLPTRRNLRPADGEGEEEQTYVNIQYFLAQRRNQQRQESADVDTRDALEDLTEAVAEKDEEDDDEEEEEESAEDASLGEPSASEAERLLMYKCILSSIVDSEALYLEGLSVMLQYMKAMKVTLTTPQPVIPKEDFDVIFYKVPDLHDLHLTFHENLKKQVERWNGNEAAIGHTFKMLASRTKIYAAFLDNYPKALDALHRCTGTFPQFAELTRSIKLRSIKGQPASQTGQTVSLEDLLHKPVARVQKHSLCLQDLIKYTPARHPDREALQQALDSVQSFVSEYNHRRAGELFPHQDRQQRHLVKNSFIVELTDGHRKLRHLFLFNDVLVCAKYKASNRRSEKFTFQLKWFIPLWQALIVEDPNSEPKESSPANLVALRTQASALRDQIYRLEKAEGGSGSGGRGPFRRQASTHSVSAASPSKSTEKQRKRLSEVEAQLLLASPQLVFQVAPKSGNKPFTFFLSSEFERSQWTETVQVLQATLPQNGPVSAAGSKPPAAAHPPMDSDELQHLVQGCRNYLNTNMGSFLMRSNRDEQLLVGDLILRVDHLQGLSRAADMHVVVEVDSYGHFFRKAKTITAVHTLEPRWNEEFILELDGSENLRLLLYERSAEDGGVWSVRGRATLELSRAWLTNKMAEQRISMNDVVLTCGMKYVTFEETIRRVPRNSGKGRPGGNAFGGGGGSGGNLLFGAPIAQAAKKEKRPVPFIVTSCVREVERRGMTEVGIYRVSGSSGDVHRLKKAYEQNAYEAEQLLKECDIHSVAGVLKQYLRELPESLFTTTVYRRLFEAYQDAGDPERRKQSYLSSFSQIPQNPNQACLVFLIEHIVRVSQYEPQNKMSLHNLATVFGPTLLNAGHEEASAAQLTAGTVDVMAQAGILHFFLVRRSRGEPIQMASVNHS